PIAATPHARTILAADDEPRFLYRRKNEYAFGLIPQLFRNSFVRRGSKLSHNGGRLLEPLHLILRQAAKRRGRNRQRQAGKNDLLHRPSFIGPPSASIFA